VTGSRQGGHAAPSLRRDTMRLVAFSDAVFAITITLLVLEIRPPSTEDESLLHGLLALWPSYLAYALTFLFIGQVWVNHHVMFDHIRAADRAVLLLNTLLLYAWRHRPLSEALGNAGARAISGRFQLALAWLATGALLGAALPVLGLAMIVAFNAFYWLPIRGESPGDPKETPT
jgi:hypothetical protein